MSSQSLIVIAPAKEPIPGRYIVTVKEGVSIASHTSAIQSSIASTDSNITHELSIINGYAGKFTDEDLNALRANPEIDSIEQDGVAYTCYETQSVLPPPPR